MANTDFGILLKTLLDKSGINSELEQVQKIVNKYSIDIMPELKTASLRNQMKAISQEIANDFNKAFGTNLTGNDVFKAFENQVKQAEKAIKDQAKAAEAARKAQEALNERIRQGQELAKKQANESFTSKQAGIYKEIIKNQEQIYALKKKLLSADELETEEINKQIHSLEVKNKYNRDYKLSNNGMIDSSWDKIVQESNETLENQYRLIEARKTDSAIVKEIANEEKERAKALEFTRKESEKLAYAIQKYSYGDSSSANDMMKQLNRGVGNFSDLSNVDKEIATISSNVDKIIDGLKRSHEQSLKALNSAISAEEKATKHIQPSIDNDTYSTQIDKLVSQFQKYGLSVDEAEEKVKELRTTLLSMETAPSNESLVTDYQKWEQQIKGVNVQLDQAKLKSEQLKKVDEIQLSMSGEGKNSYSLELARITEQYKRLGLEGDKLTKANENVKALKNAHNELADAIAKDVSEYGSLEAKNKAIISADENRIAVLNRVTNEYKEMALTAPKVLTDIQRLNKAESMQKWADGNSKAIRKYGNDINRIIQRFKELDIQMNSIESDKLVAEFKDIQNVARQNNLLGMTTFDKLKNAWEKFGGWSLATGALTKTLHQVKEGVHFIEELDDALTDVNYTSNVSSKQLEYLGDSAINMAKDLKTSASNVLEAVKIYSTANATAEDILRKAKPAIMLSNISGMSGSESSKTINTALNQFEIEDTEENLLDITDTLQYVSSQLNYDFTEGIKEITEGIEASGNVAKNAGLNLQEYATMVGLAVERTGQSGSTIGNAYKTIFSRITAASATEGTLDEDISKAEASLRAIGVQVRDSENDFRDLSHLMSDIGKVWDNLTDTQKAKVGYDVAGIRQLNVLNSLFGSWESYSDIISNVDKRTGETLKNQEIYAESLKGHLDGLVTVGQSIWNNIIESKTLKSGIDLLTGLLTVIDKLTESIGALGTIGLGAGLFAGVKNAG